jgi:5-methylcytosine-specific restriction endonuclease McrA
LSDELKLCKTCGELKPRTLEYFYRRSSAPDGLRPDCKECGAAYGKATFKAYYAARAEKLRAYQAQYRKDQREKVLTRKRLYRERNADKVAVGLRRWYVAHAEQRQKYTRDWKRTNPEKLARLGRRRRAQKVGAPGSHTAQEWLDLCAHYGNKCLACGKAKKLTADHIVPLARGGSDDIENLQPLCNYCNTRKATKTIDYRKGYRGPDSPGYEVD